MLAAVVGLAAVVSCAPGESPPEPPRQRPIDQLTSTADGSMRLEASQFTLTDPTVTSTAPTSTGSPESTESADDTGGPVPDGPVLEVDDEARRQVFDGVGAGLTGSAAAVLAALPDAERAEALASLFTPDQGAGLSVVRLVVGSSSLTGPPYSYDDSDTPDPTLSAFDIAPDLEAVIPVAREIRAADPAIEFVASARSAPAWMKDSGVLDHGSLLPRYEGVYADYLVRYLESYADEGVDIGWLAVANEPTGATSGAPAMSMDADQQARFIADRLVPALDRAGLDTRVLVWDHSWEHPESPLAILSSPDVAPLVGDRVAGTAFRCGDGSQQEANDTVHRSFPGLRLWVTECSGGEPRGAGDRSFFGTADLVLAGLRHWGNATLLGDLAVDPGPGPDGGGCSTCRGVLTVDPAAGTWSPTDDADVLAHVGRWAPPGSPVVPVTVSGAGSDPLEAAALRTDGERIVLVVANHGPATAVTVRFGDLTIPATLPARSLVTLRWST